MSYCIYLRKSRADLEAEAHGEGETLARHEKLLLDLAKKHQYNITQIYREIVSGETIAARPIVQQLLKEVEEGMWEGVLVVEVERLARGDTRDQGAVAEAFKFSNTKIITPLKIYKPDDEFDEEYFEFGLFMSRREYKITNRRLMRGRIASSKEGKWVSGIAPYGYERVRIKGDKGWTLRPVEEEADVVRMIFQFYISSEEDEYGIMRQIGTYTIAIRLDKMGIAPPKPENNSHWNSHTILAILKNPVYIGKIRWNVNKSKKRVVNNSVKIKHYKASPEDVILVDGLHPAIIDEDVFMRAQELIKSGPPPIPKGNTIKNPLAGILRCGKCGRSIVMRGSILICSNYTCNNVSSKFYIVEKRLLQALAAWLSNYSLEWSDEPQPEDAEIIKLKCKSLKKSASELEILRKQLGRTYDLLEQGVYDTKTFLARSQSLTEQITAAEANMEKLSAEVNEAEKRTANRKSIIPKVERLLNVYAVLPSAQAKNEMLKEVLESVEYTKIKRAKRGEALDDFELVLYPKLPYDGVSTNEGIDVD